MDSPDDILNKIRQDGYKFDFSELQILFIDLLITNQVYLRTILKRQLELQEILNGKVQSEIDEIVLERMTEILKKIDDVSHKEFHELLQKIVK